MLNLVFFIVQSYSLCENAIALSSCMDIRSTCVWCSKNTSGFCIDITCDTNMTLFIQDNECDVVSNKYKPECTNIGYTLLIISVIMLSIMAGLLNAFFIFTIMQFMKPKWNRFMYVICVLSSAGWLCAIYVSFAMDNTNENRLVIIASPPTILGFLSMCFNMMCNTKNNRIIAFACMMVFVLVFSIVWIVVVENNNGWISYLCISFGCIFYCLFFLKKSRRFDNTEVTLLFPQTEQFVFERADLLVIMAFGACAISLFCEPLRKTGSLCFIVIFLWHMYYDIEYENVKMPYFMCNGIRLMFLINVFISALCVTTFIFEIYIVNVSDDIGIICAIISICASIMSVYLYLKHQSPNSIDMISIFTQRSLYNDISSVVIDYI